MDFESSLGGYFVVIKLHKSVKCVDPLESCQTKYGYFRTRETVRAARQVLLQNDPQKKSISLVHSVKRPYISKWIPKLIVAGVEPTTIQLSAGSVYR